MARHHDGALDRDQQILDRLARIEHKVDSLEQTNAFALRAEADKHLAEVRKIFGRSIRRAQVYLAADGVRSVQDIAEHLGIQRQNVGRELKHLAKEGVLELVDSEGNRDIWAKKPIDRTLRISRFLCQTYQLGENGAKVPAKKGPRRVTKR